MRTQHTTGTRTLLLGLMFILAAVFWGPSLPVSATTYVWNKVTPGPDRAPTGLSYGDGTWVATASNTWIYWGDGSTWTSEKLGDTTDMGVYHDALYVEAQDAWVFAGRTSSLLARIAVRRGSDQTYHMVGSASEVRSLAMSANQVVAVGENSIVRASVSDLATWTEVFSGLGNLQDVAYGNGTFVAVGREGKMFVSTDNGATWAPPSSPAPLMPNVHLRGVTYDGSQFVVVGTVGTMLTSTDGQNWTGFTSTPSADWVSVAHGEGQYVAISTSGQVATSSDAYTWSSEASLVGIFSRVVFGNGAFLAAAHTGLHERGVEKSNNADLDGLVVSPGSLGRDFDAAVTRYMTTVLDGVTDLTVTPTVADAAATVTVNNDTIASGDSVSVPLATGLNTINVVVTAEKGNTKTYTIEVFRMLPAPEWAGTTRSFVDSAELKATLPGASGFWYARFAIYADSGYSELVDSITGSLVPSGGTSTATWPISVPRGTYYVAIMATQSSTPSPWAEQGAVQFNRKPEPPVLLSPRTAARVNTGTPTFSWSFTDPDGSADSQGAFEFNILDGGGRVLFNSYQILDGRQSYTPPPSMILPESLNWYNWRVKTWDADGVEGPFSAESYFSVDATPPTGTVTVANGDPYTTSATVSLALLASDTLSGVWQMRFSADDQNWTDWTLYQYTDTYTLPAGDGKKTVYAQFRDFAGNISESATANIILDTEPPVGSISINGGAWGATQHDVTLSLLAEDAGLGVWQMRFSPDENDWTNWEPYAETKTYTLEPGEGPRWVYAQFRDPAGHESVPVAGTIYVDTIPPSAQAGALSDYQNSRTFDVSWSGSDVGAGIFYVVYYYSQDNGSTWNSYAFVYDDPSVTFETISDGEHAFTVVAVDYAGNEEAAPAGAGSIEARTYVDTVPPSAEVTTLSPYQRSRTFDIAWNGSDVGSGIAGVKLYVSTDGGTTWETDDQLVVTPPISYTAATDGTYAFSVRAVDKAGNEEATPTGAGAGEASTVVDMVAPAITVSGLSEYQASRTFDVSWTGDDGAGSGLAAVKLYYRADGGTWTQYQTTFTASPIRFTAADDGMYDFIAVGVDNAGNEEDVPGASALPEASTLVDTQRPSAEVSVRLAPYQTERAFAINWSGTDGSGSGVDHVKLYYSINNGTTWTQDPTTFTTSPITFTAPTDGMYAFSVVAVDKAGNAEVAPAGSASIEADTIVDIEPPQNPTIQINGGAAITTVREVTLTLSAVDAVSAMDDMRFSLDGGVTWSAWESYQTAVTYQLPAGDGTKTVSVQFRDRAGNVSATVSDEIMLDQTAPTASLAVLPTYQTSRTFALAWTADDGTGSGVSHVTLFYSVDGGETWTQYQDTFTASPISFVAGGEGPYAFRVVAQDQAGHAGGTLGIQASTWVDTVAPDATVSVAGEYQATMTFPLTWGAEDHGGSGAQQAWLYYSTDGGANWTKHATMMNASPFNFTAPADGTYSFAIVAVDLAGNAKPDPTGPGAVQAGTLVDTVPPTADVIGLAPYQTNRTFSVSWDGNDAGSGVAHVQLAYSTDGGVTWTQVPDTYTASPINFTAADDGTYTFAVRAVDKAGNEQTLSGAVMSTLVDTVAPTATFGHVDAYQTNLDRTFDLPWTANDGGGSGVAYVELFYSVDGGETWTQVEDAFTASPIPFEAPTDGNYTFRLVATDNAGNVGPHGAVVVSTTVDTQEPQNPAIQINAGALYTKSTAVALTLAATDAGSGVHQMRFSVDGATWTGWEPFATERAYTLAGGDGAKSVYAQFRDEAGLVSAAVRAEILLDTTAPTASLAVPPTYQPSRTIDLAWTALDGTGSGVDHVTLFYSVDDGDTWTQYGDTFTISPIRFEAEQDGHHAFSLVAVDKVGNDAQAMQVSTLVDTEPPTTELDALSEFQTSRTFNVSWTGEDGAVGSGIDHVKLSYSVDGGDTWTQYEDTFPASPISFTAAGDGAHAFRLIGVDKAGHEEAAPDVKATTKVDTTAPEDLHIRINNGATSTTSSRVTLTLGATDATSGVAEMRFSTDDGATWSLWERYETTRSFVLPSGLGKKTVAVQFRDQVGHESDVVSAEIRRSEPPAPAPAPAPVEPEPTDATDPTVPPSPEPSEVRVDVTVTGAPLTSAMLETLAPAGGDQVTAVAVGAGEIEAALAAAEAALAPGAVAAPASVTIPVTGHGGVSAVVLDPSGVQAIVGAEAEVVVRTPYATLVIPPGTVAQAGGADPAGRMVVMVEDVGEQGFQQAVSPVVEVTLATLYPDGTLERHHQMRVPVTLALPYDPAQAGDSPVGIYLLLEDESGQVMGQLYVGGTADPSSRTVTVERPTLSKYVVLVTRRYADVPADHWAQDHIYNLTLRGTVTGVTATNYEPDREVTRAEFATMLARALALPADPAALAAFPDAEAGAWYEDTVGAAVQAGLLKGYTDGTLRPEGQISREEMATVLARVLEQRFGRPAPKPAAADSVLASYADGEQAVWSRGALAMLVESGLMQGRGATELAPQGIVTRAEATTLLRRMLELVSQ